MAEAVALDKKFRGVMTCRQLSYEGVEIQLVHVSVDEEFRRVYDQAARLVCMNYVTCIS
jgi:hypothetical protein